LSTQSTNETLTSSYWSNALMRINVTAQPNSGLVAFSRRTLLADERLVDVRNNTC